MNTAASLPTTTRRPSRCQPFALIAALVLAASPARADDIAPALVLKHGKFESGAGGLPAFPGSHFFGRASAPVGDLDGNGVGDVAVGAREDWGALYILFLNPDFTIASHSKHVNDFFGFGGNGIAFDLGRSLTNIGDLDGDGIGELAAGFPDNTGPAPGGTVILYFLNADGSLKSFLRITEGVGGFDGDLETADMFGCSVANIGDLDGNGADDLAVGACGTDGVDGKEGAVWILFLDAAGNVIGEQEITEGVGGFTELLGSSEEFGSHLAAIGDHDGDGVPDVATTSPGRDAVVLGEPIGAVWILHLNADGTLKDHVLLDAAAAGLTSQLSTFGGFGSSVAALPDMDGNGVGELLIGVPGLDDDAMPGFPGQGLQGGTFVLFLEADGSISSTGKISMEGGNFTGTVGQTANFGAAVSLLGDLDGDGNPEVGVGAIRDDVGGTDTGSFFVLSLGDAIPMWCDLGNALPGIGGFTQGLKPYGNLAPGSDIHFEGQTVGTNPGALLVVGLSAIHEPFLGGIMVPDVDLLVPASSVTSGPWPAGIPSGFEMWFQLWNPHGGGVQGYIATNAWKLTVP